MAAQYPSRPRLLTHLHRHHHVQHVGMNLAPMIDVTFLLLTFFMVASHFAAAEKVELLLPRPDENQAVNQRVNDKIVINLRYQDAEQRAALSIGVSPVASLDELGQVLAPDAKAAPARKVVLRADRRLPYGRVREVMEVVKRSGLSHLEIVTELE